MDVSKTQPKPKKQLYGAAAMGAGPGRPKGSINKATVDARHAIATFVDNNAGRLEEWLDRVAEDNPAKAFELFQSVVEYHIPKLARTEMTGKDGGPLQIQQIERKIVKADN